MSRHALAGTQLPSLAVEAIGASAISAYMAASGDDNPLHEDAGRAAALGLGGVPVPGMLVMAQFSNLIEAWPQCRCVARLAVRFLRPVIRGSGVVLDARVVRVDEAQSRAVLRLTAQSGGRIVAMGEADVVLISGAGERG